MSSLKDRIKAVRSKTEARVLPMWQSWRIAHQDHVFSDEAIELAHHVLQRRLKGYPHVRHSPSTANHCIRRSVLQYMGYPSEPVRDATTLGKFDGGNFGHLRWQMYFFDMGLLRAAEVPASDPDLRVAGTCDGIIDIPLVDWDRDMSREDVRGLIEYLQATDTTKVWSGALEIKEMFSKRWLNNRSAGQPEPKTRWQGDVYCLALQRKYPELEGTVFWFENKDTNELLEYDLPPQSPDKIAAFYGEANHLIDDGEVPPRPYTDSSYECRFCGVSEHCKRLERKGKTKVSFRSHVTFGEFDV